MPASTSRAAPSMSRLRSNWMVTEVVPRLLEEVISVTPAMWPNWRSSGVATDEAMISALAPGRLALTEIVGKSTCGNGETGSTWKAIPPAIAIATVSSVVATGRLINGVEMLMRAPLSQVNQAEHSPARFQSSDVLASSKTVVPDCQRRYKLPASYIASI